MPPKAKITKEMILNTVLEITRKTGFETVNARSIASRLQCSTRPIFTCYKNMDELKKSNFLLLLMNIMSSMSLTIAILRRSAPYCSFLFLTLNLPGKKLIYLSYYLLMIWI